MQGQKLLDVIIIIIFSNDERGSFGSERHEGE